MTSGRITVASDGRSRFDAFPPSEHRSGQADRRAAGLDGPIGKCSSGRRSHVELLEPKPEGSPRKDAPRSAPGEARAQIPAGSLEQATEERSRIGRNLGALASGQVVTWTMTLLWTLIVPRALGPVGLGLVVSAQSVSGVLTVVLGVGARNYLVQRS